MSERGMHHEEGHTAMEWMRHHETATGLVAGSVWGGAMSQALELGWRFLFTVLAGAATALLVRFVTWAAVRVGRKIGLRISTPPPERIKTDDD